MAEIDPRAFGGLERDVQHLTERIERLEQSIDKLERRISDLTALLDQARGVRWLLAIVIGLPAFVAGVIAIFKTLSGR